MSGAGPQLASHAESAEVPSPCSPQAHLLHALHQPLTALQCSLELALLVPRTAAQYVHTLREALEFTARMRALVEALRELATLSSPGSLETDSFRMDKLLLSIADELQPVAETKGVHFRIVATAPLPVRAPRAHLAAVLFRLFESALSLCDNNIELQVQATTQDSKACLTFSWTQRGLPAHSPFSQPELGLLISRVAWEQAGGQWSLLRTGPRQTCALRVPLASSCATNPSQQEES